MKQACILLMATMLFTAHQCAAQRFEVNRTTIKDLDLKRYMGRWYEIARFDHSFERNMGYCEAFYSEQGDGMISVTNTGINTETGKRKTSYGRAKAGKSPGQLRVSFFWIFYSDYNILALDEDYEWALVGSKSPKYLWILSRTRQLDSDTKQKICDIAQRRGYDTRELIWVKQ
jgi:lipocalin